MTDFRPTEEHRELRAMLRALCAAEFAPHAARWDQDKVYPKEALEHLASLGFFGLLSLVVGLLLMGFRMGTRGPNQFGKDPLQERQARVEEKRRRKKMATRR